MVILKRILALLLSVILLLVTVGCKKDKPPRTDDTSSVTDSQQNNDNSTNNDSEEITDTNSAQTDDNSSGLQDAFGNLGDYFNSLLNSEGSWLDQFSNFGVISPQHGEMTLTRYPVFEWEELSGAKSYNLKLEMQKNGKYETVVDAKNIKGTSYKLKSPLPCGVTFRYSVEAVKEDGTTKKAVNMPENGVCFMSVVDAKNNPINKGMNFEFKNGITEEVLRNYMSRMLICGVFDWHTRESGRCKVSEADDIRMILNTGAKIISRAYGQWTPSADEFKYFENMKQKIAEMHSVDPDIVFEACIFETTCDGMNQIPIPAWVFEAFGLPVENRNFSQEAMDFKDGTYKNIWGAGINCPDIRELETQMFIYYRAVTFIDLGFEALHFGQVDLVSMAEPTHESYTKVFKMIRDYAAKNSRRGWVLLNAHHRIGYVFADPTGKYLLEDYTGFPVRMLSSPDDVMHVPTEDNPQQTFINSGDPNSLINRSVAGITPSGYYTEHQLYKLELDNYGSDLKQLHQPYIVNLPWGLDEISWFANQPSNYRKYWLEYAYNRIHSLDNSGYFEMPGKRIAYIYLENDPMDGEDAYYYANSSEFSSVGFDDEKQIKNVWLKNNPNNK